MPAPGTMTLTQVFQGPGQQEVTHTTSLALALEQHADEAVLLPPASCSSPGLVPETFPFSSLSLFAPP